MPRARSIFAALAFLTGLPLPQSLVGDDDDLGRSAVFFPVLGLAIGLFVLAVDRATAFLFGAPLLGSAASVLTMIAASRALHLDGLADTFDGFLSSRPKGRILEIMRDSRVGAMGVLGIVGVVLVKWSAISSLPEQMRSVTLVLMPVAGRTALVFSMGLLPYARADGGLATVFKPHCGPWQMIFAAAVLGGAGWGLLGWPGLSGAFCAVASTAVFAAYCYRRIGGFTGDTLGASAEIVELAPALAVLAWGT